MRSIIKSIIFNIGIFFSYLQINRAVEKIKIILQIFMNGYLSKRFNSCGKENTFRKLVLTSPKGIKIGSQNIFDHHCILSTWGEIEENNPKLIIGNGCSFGEYNHITAFNRIVIGNNVLTGRWVTISDNAHGQSDIESLKISPLERPIYSKGAVSIKDNVWIGDKVTVLAGVTIGESAIIGANAVVTMDVPPYSIAVGNPIRVIKR